MAAPVYQPSQKQYKQLRTIYFFLNRIIDMKLYALFIDYNFFDVNKLLYVELYKPLLPLISTR